MAIYTTRGARLDFSAGNFEQAIVRAVGLKNGGFAVGWLGGDDDRTAIDGDTFGTVYDADLIPVSAGPMPWISDTGPSPSYPVNLALSGRSSGGFALVSTDNAAYPIDQATQSRDVVLRLYDPSGSAAGSPVTLGTASILGTTVTSLSDGRLVAGWVDPSGSLRAQYLTDDGVKLGSSFSVAAPVNDFAARPSFAALAGGGWVATYISQNANQARATFFDGQGAAIADRAIASNVTGLLGLQAAQLADGRYVMLWTEEGAGQLPSTRGQIITSSGLPFVDAFSVSNASTSIVSVSGLSDGGFVVALEGRGTTTVELKVFNSIGQVQGSPTFIADARDPSVSALADGGFVVSWKNAGSVGMQAQAFGSTPGPAMELTGSSGADRLAGQDGADTIYGLAGADLLYGSVGNDRLFGGEGDDVLDGGAGNDVLDGGFGTDRMAGGAGDDVYIVDNSGDVMVEHAGEGIDQARSTAQLVALSDNVEQLVHIGAGGVVGYGNALANSMAGGAKSDFLSAFSGNDLLNGWAGDDVIHGGAGDDIINGGTGMDMIYGGEGVDTLVLAGTISDYTVAKIGDAWAVTGGSTDTVTGFEKVLLGGETIDWDIFQSQAFDALRYIASHPDLIRAYGANADAGKQHYAWAGQSEGRSLTAFDPLIYAASHPDVFAAFGQDRQALTRHYIENGFAEGRSTASFDPVIYAASHLDVARAFGYDREALTQHFLEEGLRQGRDPDSFDPLRYGASNPDVAQAFGTDVAALSRHWIDYGSYEGRSATSFDPREYAAVNTDVARAFGTDLKAITLHYIQDGITQGRATSGFDEVGYLLSYSDLGDAGLGANGAFSHWLSDGIYQNRFGDAEFGREQDSHSLLVNGTTSAAFETAGDHDWFQFAASAGQQVSIDLRGVAGTLDLHRSDGSLVATSNTGSLDVAVSAADSFYLSTYGNSAATGEYFVDAFVV